MVLPSVGARHASPLHGHATGKTRYALGLCLLCVLVLLALTGCGPQEAGSTPTTQPPTATSEAGSTSTAQPPTPTSESGGAAQQPDNTPTEQAAQGTPTAAVAANTFQNPVFRSDFPDPEIIKEGDTFYAYATNGLGRNIQVATSPDLVHWKLLNDAMPALAPWAKLGGLHVWAPEVIKIGQRYVMYYTARDKKADRQCVGVATSDKPDGPFQDTSDHALVCQADEGGSIDPDPFRDGDKLYLYWKNDGNCCNQPTYIYVQELAPDGLSLTGQPTQLVRNDAPWEGQVVESPTMWKQDGKYYLFFSGNSYAGFDYAVGYATCQTVTGPCQDATENPILKSHTEKPLVVGPGHEAIIKVGDETWIVYHAWEVTSAGTRGSRRFMWIDRLDWKDGKPDVIGPTTDPQPAPVVK
ncbi:MAG: glycoside hydrolase family 43 protein [Chloroflexia bacterium]